MVFAAGQQIAFRFKEEHATEAAAYLLQKSGGRMTRLKLIKLLYFADRDALNRLNRPICGGEYYALDRGPIISEAYNAIKGSNSFPIWKSRLNSIGRDVVLVEQTETSELSRAQRGILDEVYEQWGSKTIGALLDHAHSLPEWVDPRGSSVPIIPRVLMGKLGKSTEEIDEIFQSVRDENASDDLFSE